MTWKLKSGNSLLIGFIALACLNKGCIDKYWPDDELRLDKMIVVDGMITNNPGPYNVYMSLSSSVNEPEFIPLSNYALIISDDQGNQEVLSYKGNGLFQTSPEGIQGVIGRSYKLIIHSYDGDIYESEYELLRKPTEIDSVYAEIEFHSDRDFEYNLSGYQYYVHTKKADNDNISKKASKKRSVV